MKHTSCPCTHVRHYSATSHGVGLHRSEAACPILCASATTDHPRPNLAAAATSNSCSRQCFILTGQAETEKPTAGTRSLRPPQSLPTDNKWDRIQDSKHSKLSHSESGLTQTSLVNNGHGRSLAPLEIHHDLGKILPTASTRRAVSDRW